MCCRIYWRLGTESRDRKGGGRRRRDFTYNAIKRESVCEKTFIGTIILLSKLFVDDSFVGIVS